MYMGIIQVPAIQAIASALLLLSNSNKTSNNIKLSDLTYEASCFDANASKESVSLSVLDAFLQVIYTMEQVKNAKRTG